MRFPGRFSVAVALAALAVAAPRASRAQEREEILSYDVTIGLEAGGWMEVTEEIRVRALGQEIRRGIYRDFPTSFPTHAGLGRVTAPFEVVRVLRDGEAEPHVLLSVGGPASRGGIRVRIGDASRNLTRGEHVYSITYRTARWMTFDEDADRLYWNVTGNGWAFPILSTSATVLLPGPSEPPPTLEAWTGPEGSTDSRAFLVFEPELGDFGAAYFATTSPLGPNEGLTVRVTIPKGVVPSPTEAQLAAWRRLDWGPYIDSAWIIALVLAVYVLLWHRVGVDPAGRPLTVRYEPPEGFSPAALGFIERRGFASDQMTAALVSLAVKGFVEIEREGRTWVLKRMSDSTEIPPAADVSPDEAKLFDELFGGGGRTLTLRGTSHPTVRKAAKALKRALKARLEKRYFVTNRGWFVAGLLVTLVAYAALAWRVRFSITEGAWFLGVWLTFWTVGVTTLLARAASEWRQAISGDALSWVTAIFISLFSLPFVAAEIFVGTILWRHVPPHLPVVAIVLGAINVLFYHLLERPTLKGRGVLNELEGFKAFISATESPRLDRLQPADASLELFERFLPYAIALGAESAWADRFEGALRATDGAPGRHPAWYSGSGSSSISLMTSSLSGAFASSLSASSSAPSSSGGGGGGGSSGGGGGGGGGGGW